MLNAHAQLHTTILAIASMAEIDGVSIAETHDESASSCVEDFETESEEESVEPEVVFLLDKLKWATPLVLGL